MNVLWQISVMITRLLRGATDSKLFFPPVRVLFGVVNNLLCFPSELRELRRNRDKNGVVLRDFIYKLLVVIFIHHDPLEVLNLTSLCFLELDMSVQIVIQHTHLLEHFVNYLVDVIVLLNYK